MWVAPVPAKEPRPGMVMEPAAARRVWKGAASRTLLCERMSSAGWPWPSEPCMVMRRGWRMSQPVSWP